MNCLIIDDDKGLANVIKELFQTRGFANIDIAHDGVEGLIHISNNKYDCIYIDNKMPYLTGIEVLREIRKHSINRETPIIMMSADLPPIINEEEITVNNTIFMPKPVDFKRFDRYVALLSNW